SPAWQKCLVLEQLATFERVVWIDADIVINISAPPVTEGVPLGKIGAVLSGGYLHADMRAVFLERRRGVKVAAAREVEAWQQDQASWYQRVGIASPSPDIVQTGVLVLDQSHRVLLRSVYDAPYPGDLMCYEQFPLSADILKAGLLHEINSRFNVVFI